VGIGDWGLGIGDWAQSPIPNPQSPFLFIIYLINNYYDKRKLIIKIRLKNSKIKIIN